MFKSSMFAVKPAAEKPLIDEDNLRACGFTVVCHDDKKLHLKHVRGGQLIISTQKFRHKADAVAFAAEYPLPAGDLPQDSTSVGSITTALLLAMSGVCNKKNKFIKDAIAFKFSNSPEPDYQSGIYAWGEGDDKVILLWNGHGAEHHSVSVDEIKEKFGIDIELPAVYGTF